MGKWVSGQLGGWADVWMNEELGRWVGGQVDGCVEE